MTYRPRWRKAIGISILFHMLFLGVIGWLAGKAVTSVEEPYIELELLTDAAMDDSVDDQLPNSQSAPSAPTVPTMQIKNKSAVSTVTTQVVAMANELEMEAVEAVTSSQSVSDNESAGNSSSGSDAVGNSGSGGSGTNVGSSHGGNRGRKGKIIWPQVLSKVEPDYPERAKSAGLAGTVKVKIQILTNGLPGEVTISKTSGHDILDAAALAAVRKWIFVPAKDSESGASIMCYTNVPITFQFK